MKKRKEGLLIQDRLRIAITNTCNLSCFYCHNEGQELNCKARFLSLDYIKDMCKWFKDNNVYVKAVNITGGEPFLHPQLFDIIDEVKEITDDVRINTNGTLLSEAIIDKLIEHNVSTIKVGIDSLYTKQSKPNIYQSKHSIEHIIDMIKYANERMNVVLNTVVTKFNYTKIDEMIDFARSTRISRLKIIRLHNVDSRGFNDKNVEDDLKTDQKEGEWYYYFYSRYIAQAVEVVNNRFKGRTDAIFDDGFTIRFCEDICNFGACGNMFTEIDSCGNIIICPKYHISKSIDFKNDYRTVKNIIELSKKKMCNAKTNNFEMREKMGNI